MFYLEKTGPELRPITDDIPRLEFRRGLSIGQNGGFANECFIKFRAKHEVERE